MSLLVKDYPKWERNDSGCLCNTNKEEYKRIMLEREKFERQRKEIEELKFKQDQTDIKLDEINNKMNQLISLLQSK